MGSFSARPHAPPTGPSPARRKGVRAAAVRCALRVIAALSVSRMAGSTGKCEIGNCRQRAQKTFVFGAAQGLRRRVRLRRMSQLLVGICRGGAHNPSAFCPPQAPRFTLASRRCPAWRFESTNHLVEVVIIQLWRRRGVTASPLSRQRFSRFALVPRNCHAGSFAAPLRHYPVLPAPAESSCSRPGGNATPKSSSDL
jgi:hypothetical protein